ncbi:hypothetical protein SSS_08535 [Sarcoptes scabiei]|nr:hypothetical protein SSS_08535 [Sarcoptes scabiei]
MCSFKKISGKPIQWILFWTRTLLSSFNSFCFSSQSLDWQDQIRFTECDLIINFLFIFLFVEKFSSQLLNRGIHKSIDEMNVCFESINLSIIEDKIWIFFQKFFQRISYSPQNKQNDLYFLRYLFLSLSLCSQ